MSTAQVDFSGLTGQLQEQRRTVDFDTFDITIEQLLAMLEKRSIDIAPIYQRQFRWDDGRCSELIESYLLGIPVPSLFMATNANGTWELVDGVQRLSTLVRFAGSESLRHRLGAISPRIASLLKLEDLEKLTQFNALTFAELPESVKLHFLLRPVKVVTLNDKSDAVVRFDLFERLNTGGIALTAQEIRNCVYRGRFSEFLEEMAKDQNFNKVMHLTVTQKRDGTKEECVLRFFAFFYRYKSFVHSVLDFLNDYMETASKSFNYAEGERVFKDTFHQLATALPEGIRRPRRKGTTPLNLFEGVAVGAAMALKQKKTLRGNCGKWMDSPKLREYTMAATNSPIAVRGRIEFCRDKFLGK